MKHLRNIPLCANTLFIYKLDIKEDLTLKFKKEKFRFTSGPSLINEDFNTLKRYKTLNKEINKAVDTTLKEILMLKTADYKIYRSWLTKTEPKGFSNSHLHNNSWLSGVYYPKGDPGFSIKFYYDFRSQFFTLPTEYNIYNSNDWTVIPEDNFLILFFSQLRHEIMPNNSTKDRFSLAFNILPKGEFGARDSKAIF